MSDYEIIHEIFIRVYNLAIYQTIYLNIYILSSINDFCCKRMLWYVVSLFYQLFIISNTDHKPNSDTIPYFLGSQWVLFIFSKIMSNM